MSLGASDLSLSLSRSLGLLSRSLGGSDLFRWGRDLFGGSDISRGGLSLVSPLGTPIGLLSLLDLLSRYCLPTLPGTTPLPYMLRYTLPGYTSSCTPSELLSARQRTTGSSEKKWLPVKDSAEIAWARALF